jgi:hypothetical protein
VDVSEHGRLCLPRPVPGRPSSAGPHPSAERSGESEATRSGTAKASLIPSFERTARICCRGATRETQMEMENPRLWRLLGPFDGHDGGAHRYTAQAARPDSGAETVGDTALRPDQQRVFDRASDRQARGRDRVGAEQIGPGRPYRAAVASRPTLATPASGSADRHAPVSVFGSRPRVPPVGPDFGDGSANPARVW